ncbi:DUF2062 domain-containing protein [Zobellia galactanivorans]|uniref:DUF2062 domain-containing protein n=1 Tax=Zobellia galactanivorans (strain DSM 12802 / CCUG 47099 / CIP 106680 / NCIMB 13871 / Dsij) TaxID=63186 RepID=UPI001C076691|nr:DUF2062 domain-containing protein [Zobellia galactanivorans]MBU3026428.1 DUF2062 domain-containing protein [Zobellia galactanivorans]MDO6810039.1 DUF2062 domain-containing protein [Zobellia galactanivorans]
MQQLNCCVLVPTYNNAGTLKRVLDSILERTDAVIVINDGATDGTSDILKNYPTIEQIHLPENKGKGNALQVGFKAAISQGYDYAITIDSDGQHFPEDLSVFLDELQKEETPNVLYIGSRNMQQEDVPGKSSFGNKFSNFWFWFETGTKLQDTQCGYRLYPLHALKDLKFYTPKFEFEIEVIVRLAWDGTLVKNVPVRILYDETERVSHFRTVPDFARISVLNTWLVIVTIFYIKPRNFIRKIKKKGFKKFLLEDLLRSDDSPKIKALSIALGIFLGIAPFWGFQTILVFALATVFRLNKAITFAFSNISLPPLIPFIVYFSIKIGVWITGEEVSFSMEHMTENFGMLQNLKTYLIGSFALAIMSALLFGIIGYLTIVFFGKKKIIVDNG